MSKKNSPLVLIILDGWGHREEKENNGIAQAKKPFFDSLWQNYLHTLVDGSGPAVGLPNGVMGNSEVGHMNIGAGRIVYSGLSQIYHAIEDGTFFTNPALLKAVHQAKKAGGTLHLMGLLSDGAVHSHQDHLYALLRLVKQNNVKKVLVHCFMDGRDTPPADGVKYIRQLEEQCKKIGVGRIASVSGRYFAMDRDQRWERIEKAFHAVCGTSSNTTTNAAAYLERAYEKNVGDEFIEPVSVAEGGRPPVRMGANDAVIFFNFRADRAREMTRAFVDKKFSAFPRGAQELPAVFVCLALYDKEINTPVAFMPTYPEKTLPEMLSQKGIRQLRIAETEKYAHVTFFFNGGRDVVFDGEDRKLIPSPREVPTYDLKPEMSAFKVKDELLRCLDSGTYGFVVCNFANTDMVGHTAKPEAIRRAVEIVDECLAQIVPKVTGAGGVVIITADHGNAEEIVDETGAPMTAHTLNLVPFILVGAGFKPARQLRSGGRLCDIAPTILEILGVPKPKEMTGESLISTAPPYKGGGVHCA